MGSEILLILPQLILVIAGMAIMLMEPFTPPERKSRTGQITVLATALAAYSLGFQWTPRPRSLFNGMFVADNFSVFFQWLFLIITGVCALVSMRFNERESMN